MSRRCQRSRVSGPTMKIDQRSRPSRRERSEDRTIVGLEPRTWLSALQHDKLVAQHEDLDVFGTIARPRSTREVEYQPDKTVETCLRADPPSIPTGPLTRTPNRRSPARTDIRHPQGRESAVPSMKLGLLLKR